MDLGPLAVMLIMFGSLIVLLMSGLPVVFGMGAIGTLLVFVLWGPTVAPFALNANAFAVMSNYSLIAIPFFVFMALILRSSGVAHDLFSSMRLWFDRVPGGMAMAVVAVSVVIAAMSGVIATGIVILGIVAVPEMLRVGYSKEMALGPVMAGGCLAQLIPPSTGFIVYGSLAEVSVGRLFVGGIVPGLLLAGLFMLYIGIRCTLKPELAPAIPKENRGSMREKITSLRSLILPGALIVVVLGSVFFGVAAATEAAALGAGGAIVCAAIRRRLTWTDVREACISTGKVTAMLIWIFFGAYCFKTVFVVAGGPHYVTEWVAGLNIDDTSIIGVMQLIFITMGCFVQEVVIQLISMPVFLPIVDSLELSRLWFGVLFLTTAQLSFLTPPFGFALFYMKSVAPEGVGMSDIVKSVLPYIPLQIIPVILVLLFPVLATWLPGLMIGS